MTALTLSSMRDEEWDRVVGQLTAAAEGVVVLARCLAVGPELAKWRAGDEIAGMSAADGLDQARGDLERLAGGGAANLLGVVQRVLRELPVPLE